jgi:hypothetical protein
LPTIDLSNDDQAVDGALWIALLARPREDRDLVRDIIGGRTLTLGLLPALDDPRCSIDPAGSAAGRERPSLVFEFPDVERLPASPPGSPAAGPVFRSRNDARGYVTTTVRMSGDVLRHPGRVEIDLPEPARLGYWDDLDPLESGAGDLPPSLEATDDESRLLSWIRVSVRDTVTQQMTARFSWVGINAADVIQRTHVAAERLPDGNGEPDQVATLTNAPVLTESVRLTVGGEVWRRIDDLSAAAPEVPVGTNDDSVSTTSAGGSCAGRSVIQRTTSVAADPLEDAKVFTVDRESGEIRFGNGARGFRPPAGAVIQAAYDFGGGRQGQVGIGAIKQAPALSSNLGVRNPVPTWGGSDGETVAEAERRIPNVLRHREQIVSVTDCREITYDTPGVELGRVEVLSLFHPESPKIVARGVITVLVIPRRDPLQPDAPRADRLFVETVCRYLEPRRVLTTELHVRGPVYVPVWVSIGIDVVPGFDTAPVREAVAGNVRTFLSALRGGFEGAGWPLNKAVEAAEIAAAATRVAGVASVNGVLVAGVTGEANQPIVLEGLQLPVVRAVSVVAGDPLSLEEIRGQLPLDGDGGGRVPVPVVPEEC